MGELAAGREATPVEWDYDQVCQVFALEPETQGSSISLSKDGCNA